MVSQFLCLFATLFPILNHSSQSPSQKKRSNQQIRRACSMGSLSIVLASGIVQAQTSTTVQGEEQLIAESPLSGAIAPNHPSLPVAQVDGSQVAASPQVGASEIQAAQPRATDHAADPELKLSAASVSADRYRSVHQSEEARQTSLQPLPQSADEAERALINQMSAAPSNQAFPSAKIEATPSLPSVSTSVSQTISEIQDKAVQGFQASAEITSSIPIGPIPDQQAAQPIKSLALELPAQSQPSSTAHPPAPSVTLVADKDLETGLGIHSASVHSSSIAAAPPPTFAVQSNSLPQVQPAAPYPGYQPPVMVSQQAGYPLSPSGQPSYAPTYAQPYPTPAAPVYAAPSYPAAPYGAPQPYPIAYPPQAYPQGGYASPGYAVPVAQPYYYVAYPAPGVMGMPMYMAPPTGAPGTYPTPYIAPGYPTPTAPSYPATSPPSYPIAGGYPTPYPVAGGYPAPPVPPSALPATHHPTYTRGVAATPPLLMPAPRAGYSSSQPYGISSGVSRPLESVPGTLPLPPSANSQTSWGTAPPPRSAPVNPPVNLPVSPTSSPVSPSAPTAPPLDPNPVLATPNGSVPALEGVARNEVQQAVGGPLDSPTPTPNPTFGAVANSTSPSVSQTQASLPQRQPGQLLRTSALGKPEYSLQGVFISEGPESAGRARLSTTYPLTSNLLFGGSFDVSSGDIFSVGETSGFSVNELYAATSIQQVPNLRFLVGQLDLTSYFDRNSFAKDSATHFFNSAFQTNPALSAAGISSRTGLLMNWSATDNIELKAAAFSSDSGLGGFGLDGFAGEIGFRYGNAIVRGTFASDRDSGNEDGFREAFAAPRPGGGVGLRSDDREQAYGVNAEWFIPNLNMGVFGRYGRYENRDLDEGGDTFSVGLNFQDVFSPDDRLGLAYGQNLSNDGLRRKLGIDPSQDVLELFYDFRFLSNLRLGFSLQGRDKLSEAAAGFRLKAEFDTKPSGNLQEVR